MFFRTAGVHARTRSQRSEERTAVGARAPRRAWTRAVRNVARTLALAAVAAAGTLLALDRIFPPDLSRYEARSVEVLDADSRLLRAFTAPDSRWRLKATPADVDPLYLSLLKAYEDQRFDSHLGVDPLAAARAAFQYATRGRIVSGASTLSMQAARLLQPHQRRTFTGKLLQSARALQLEWRYSKDEILSIYLTLAPFGGNIEGVRAAALAYFGKEPRRLTPAEAALLVALPQSPERRRPDRFPDRAHAARDMVLQRVHERGAIDDQTLREAMAQPSPDQRLALPRIAPHVSQMLAARPPADGIIRTTIRRELQATAARLAAEERSRDASKGDIAVVIVDNRKGAIVAWHGGDLTGRQGYVDLVRAKRSPGSTLKPFIYGIAFDDGVAHPETFVDDAPIRFGDWMPRNFDGEHQGTLTIRRALQQSLNVPAVAALERIGAARFLALLRQSGVAPALPRGPGEPASLALALGGVGLSPLDLATLYAGLARDGTVRPLRLRAEDPVADGFRLMGPGAAWHVRDILANGPLPDGWTAPTRPLDGRRGGDRVIAFKTGTSYGFRDAWAAGVSGAYTIVVWTGRADGAPLPGRYGRDTALPILLKLFEQMPGEAAPHAAPPPDALIVARNSDLPPAMRVLIPQAARLQAATATLAPAPASSGMRAAAITPPKPPRILYPVANSTLEVTSDAVPLKAEGGSGALRWLVDGKPVPDDRFRAFPLWHPGGAGRTRLTVIDASGRSATIEVQIRMAGR
ncbi:penicillin-binding protein 1C [Vineibacter terrae]|uniref:peptidoglycan glycosyltransferase n=2 Tax=Vineibacter terrae TaxID=2586908 RepID=A0A5C8P9J2_9HYPH|nr:penicillin-binding protein 1C [Vineibacter terrae]